MCVKCIGNVNILSIRESLLISGLKAFFFLAPLVMSRDDVMGQKSVIFPKGYKIDIIYIVILSC